MTDERSSPPPPRIPRKGNLIHPPESESSRTRAKRRTPEAPKRTGPGSWLLLLLLPLLAFSPIFNSSLLHSHYDEVERSRYAPQEHWSEAWTLESIRANDPISLSSYSIEETLPLPTPQLHRAINVLLHLLAAFLLLKVLELFRAPGALAAALVFAVHPAVVPVLFWPGYRAELVGLVLILGALFFGIRKRGTQDYILTLVFTGLGALAHPAALAIPIILALTIPLRQRQIHLSHFNPILPLVCLSLFVGVFLYAGDAAESTRNWTDSLHRSSQNTFFFIRRALLPFDSALFYPFKQYEAHRVHLQSSLLPFALFLPFFILAAFNLRKAWARAILLGLSSYLLLALHGILTEGRFLDGAPAHEDYGQYVALPALLALLVVGAARLLQQMTSGGKLLWRLLFPCFFLFEITIAAAFAQSIGTPTRMWQNMAKNWPDSWIPKAAFIETLHVEDQKLISNQQKIEMLEAILAGKPELTDQRLQLARTYEAGNQPTNAVREYKRLLREPYPSTEVLAEAAEVFQRHGLHWEAANARDRIRATAQNKAE